MTRVTYETGKLSVKPMRIVPKLELRGTQLAGWTPSSGSVPSASGILFDENINIPMPDGSVLKGNLYRPAGRGPVPLLVSWATYNKDMECMGGIFPDESGISSHIIRAGYAELRVQPRGTGLSKGTPAREMFSPVEIQDCYDAIEWAAAQSWCNGEIGMIGMSAFAVSQLLAAAKQPPHLKAIFPYKGFTDLYRHGFYKGGAPYTGAIELFAFAEKLKLPKIPSWLRHLSSYILNHRFFARHTSDAAANVQAIHKMLRKTAPPEAAIRSYVSRMYDNTFDDDDYYRSSSPANTLSAIDIPVCIATDFGAQGFHFFGAFELWHRLRGPKKMFFGPPEYEFPWSNYLREAVAWYDWTLKGIDNGYAALPPVRYWLRGAERWKSAVDWPIPASSPQFLYLHRGDESECTPQTLTAIPPDAAHASSFISLPSNSFYVAALDKYETQIIRFSTLPYERKTEITGPVKLRLTVSASAIDTYIVARLSDLAPNGKRTKLAWGWLLASHRTVDPDRSNPTEIVHDHRAEAAKQLIPGIPSELYFSLTPISNLFKPGHRMELEIASRPELLVSEAGEGFDMFTWDPVPYRCRTTIHTGGERPSCLEVMIVDMDSEIV